MRFDYKSICGNRYTKNQIDPFWCLAVEHQYHTQTHTHTHILWDKPNHYQSQFSMSVLALGSWSGFPKVKWPYLTDEM